MTDASTSSEERGLRTTATCRPARLWSANLSTVNAFSKAGAYIPSHGIAHDLKVCSDSASAARQDGSLTRLASLERTRSSCVSPA